MWANNHSSAEEAEVAIVDVNVVAGDSGLTELPVGVQILVLNAGGDTVGGGNPSGIPLPLEGIPFDFPGIDGTYTVVLTGIDADTATFTIADGVVKPGTVTLTLVGEADPDPEAGTLEIVKWFCPSLTEVDTTGEITDDCYHGNAVFTVYLYGDGTDEVIAQVETGDDGNVVVELAPGDYEVVEESTLVKMDVTIVAGENRVISFANPVGDDGNGTDNGVDNGDDNGADNGAGHDADNGKDADAGKDADKHADAGKAADGKKADAGKAADGKKTEEVETLPSTGSGQAASSQAWMLMAGAAVLSAVGFQVTRRQTNS